jgi:thiamine kinase-like enzyme
MQLLFLFFAGNSNCMHRKMANMACDRIGKCEQKNSKKERKLYESMQNKNKKKDFVCKVGKCKIRPSKGLGAKKFAREFVANNGIGCESELSESASSRGLTIRMPKIFLPILFFMVFMQIISDQQVLCNSSCGTRPIDENYAALVTKKALAISGPVSANVLVGGLSGAPIFKVTTDSSQYVARFLVHKIPEKREREVACLKIASQEGYGPHLYFVDSTQEYVIMEYVKSQPLSVEQRQTDEPYRALGNLLRKMHHGPAFPGIRNVFDEIQKYIQILYAKNDGSIPLAKVEQIVAPIHQAVTPYLTSMPSHSDLNPNNLLFMDNECKAIDYEGAVQSDPYVDVATVAVFYCSDSKHEKELLSTYLGRQPSPKEAAQLSLMKEVVRMSYALLTLVLVPKTTYYYNDMQVEFQKDFFEYWRTVNLNYPESQMNFAKTLLEQVFADAESRDYKNAVRILMDSE